MRRAVVLIAALLGALVLAASAQASSLVFIKNSNVWLANPDGSSQYQVTLDGTPDGPYYSPSQADDGTIVAARGSTLYRMSQNGALLNTPFETDSPLGNLQSVQVSPDGRVVAYGFTTITATGRYNTPTAVEYTFSDHFGDPGDYGQQRDVQEPSWTGNGRVLLSTNSQNEFFDDVGGGDGSYSGGSGSNGTWWSDCDVYPDDCMTAGRHYPHQMQMSRAGDRLALVRYTGDTPDATAALDFLTANGGPPAIPAAKCEATGPNAGSLTQTFSHPSWSPDGQALAWQEGDGVHVAQVGNLDDCSTITGFENAVITDGSEPFWGPAGVNPAPRSQGSAPSGGSTPTNGGGSPSGGSGATTPSKARCVVPKLKGKTLAKAKTALKKAHCKLGKVKKPRHVKHGAKLVVSSQTARARSKHPAGTKVGVKLAVHR